MKIHHSLRTRTLACLAVMAMGLPASALASLELADKSACLNCHRVSGKMVGPSFSDVAARYKARKDGPSYLAERIVKGSAGVWGPVPMPAHSSISVEEARVLAAWIANMAETR